MFSRPAARSGSDTLPDALDAKTDPVAAASDDPSTTNAATDESSTDPGPPPEMSLASESARVDDVLRNMKGPRVWSPPAATSAESRGADFVAYHAVGEPAKRHDTPATGARVVLDITVPSPPPAAEEGANPPADELAALIQESRLAGSSDGRDGATVVRASRRRPAFAIFAVALLVVLVVGGVALWGPREGGGEARSGSATAAVTANAPSAPVAATVSARPSAQPSVGTASPSVEAVAPAASSTSEPAVTPPQALTAGARAASVAPPSPRSTATKVAPSPARSTPTPPSPPALSEPKSDNPKNDLPRSL